MESRLLLNVAVRQHMIVGDQLASKDQSLPVGRNAARWMGAKQQMGGAHCHSPFLVLNLHLHVVDCVRRLELERDRLAGKHLYEDLHDAEQQNDEIEC